jgi:hypothetical protein
VNIGRGILGVAATGEMGGVSVDINGTVLPSGTLTLLNSAPGEVIFNSKVLSPTLVNLPVLTGIAAELNRSGSMRTMKSQSCCSMCLVTISSRRSHYIANWMVACE